MEGALLDSDQDLSRERRGWERELLMAWHWQQGLASVSSRRVLLSQQVLSPPVSREMSLKNSPVVRLANLLSLNGSVHILDSNFNASFDSGNAYTRTVDNLLCLLV